MIRFWLPLIGLRQGEPRIFGEQIPARSQIFLRISESGITTLIRRNPSLGLKLPRAICPC